MRGAARRPRSPRSASARPTARCGSLRRRSCRAAPTKTRCRRSGARSRRRPIPRSRACSTLDAGVDRSSRAPTARRGSPRSRRSAESDDRQRRSTLLLADRSTRRTASSSSPTTSVRAAARALAVGRSKRACARARSRRASSAASRLGTILLLAALGPRDHLRPDGRHQHGPRRDADDRRLRDLRRAEPVPQLRARRVRLVPAVARSRSRSLVSGAASAWRSSARVIRCLYGRPLETLLATWGISLHPDPDRAHDLRRAERRRSRTRLDVGRHRDHDQRRAAVQPHRHHRCSRRSCSLPSG